MTGPLTLPSAFSTEAVLIARHLALAYQKQQSISWRFEAPGERKKRLDRAERIYDNIFSCCQTNLSFESGQTIVAANELGRFYESQAKIDQARKLYTTSLQSIRQNLGPSHPHAVELGFKLAKTYEMEPKWEQAEKEFQELVDILSKYRGVVHQATAEMILSLSRVCKRQGKCFSVPKEYLFQNSEVVNTDQARPISKRNLSIEYRHWDFELQELEKSGDLGEASLFCRKMYNRYLERLGIEHKITFKASLRLGSLLKRQDRFSEGVELHKYVLNRSGTSHLTKFPSRHYETVKSLANLCKSRADKGPLMGEIHNRGWNCIQSLEDAFLNKFYRRVFRGLFFCLRNDCNDPHGAQSLLEDTWNRTKVQSRDSESFWATICKISTCYIILDLGEVCLRRLEEERVISEEGKIASNYYTSIHKCYREFNENSREKYPDLAKFLKFRHHIRIGPQQGSWTEYHKVFYDLTALRCQSQSERELILKLLRECFEDWQEKDPTNENTLHLGQQLATELLQQNRYKEQEELLRKMFTTCRTVLGEADATTIDIANKLAECLRNQGLWEENKELLTQIWVRCKIELGETNRVTISAGKALVSQGEQSQRETRAKTVFRGMLDSCWKAEDLGPSHSTTWDLANRLAEEIQSRHEVRLLAYKLYLDLRESNLNAELGLHSYRNLLQWSPYAGRGFVGIWSQTWGASLAELTDEDMKALSHAKEIYEYYLDQDSRINGAFTSISYREDYFELLKGYHRPEEACAMLEKAWEMRPSPTSWDSRAISLTGLSLAKAYFKTGQQIEAIDLLRTICNHDELAYASTDETSEQCLAQLSKFLFAQKKCQEALDIHNKIFAAADVAFSEKNQCRTPRMRHRNTSRPIRGDISLPHHDIVVRHSRMKGNTLQRLGKYDEARSVYDEVFQKIIQNYGPFSWYAGKLGNIRAWEETESPALHLFHDYYINADGHDIAWSEECLNRS